MIKSRSKEPNLAQRYVLENWRRLLKKYWWAGDPEDLRQTVLLKLEPYDDDFWEGHINNLFAYVQKIIRNCAYDAFRKNGKERATDGDELNRLHEAWLTQEVSIGRDPTETYLETFIGQELLSVCSEDDRTFIELLHLGFTLKEIAFELDLSYDAVRKRSQRLGRKLRLLMESSDKSPPYHLLPGS